MLAIVAVLLTIALPRYFAHLETAKAAVLRENLRLTREVIQRFYADTGRYPDSLDQLVEFRYLTALPMDPFLESSDAWLITPPPAGHDGLLYDLHSGSTSVDRDGRTHQSW